MAGGEGETDQDGVEGELGCKSENFDLNFKFYQQAVNYEYVIFLLCALGAAPVLLWPRIVGVGVG